MATRKRIPHPSEPSVMSALVFSNPEAEAIVLAYILATGDSFILDKDHTRKDGFIHGTFASHALKSMMSIHDGGKKVSFASVADYLTNDVSIRLDFHGIDRNEIVSNLRGILNRHSTDHVKSAYESLVDAWKRREIASNALIAMEQLGNPNVPMSFATDHISSAIDRIMLGQKVDKDLMDTIEEELYSDTPPSLLRFTGLRGYSMSNKFVDKEKILSLDDRLGAMDSTDGGGIMVVMGDTGMGKSIFENTVLFNCFEQDIPCWSNSSETSAKRRAKKLLAALTGFPAYKIMKRRNAYGSEYFNDEEKAKISHYARQVSMKPLWITDKTGYTAKEWCAEAKRRWEKDGLKVAIFDRLELFRMRDKSDEQITLAMEEIRQLWVQTGLTIIVFCQMSRAKRDRTDKRPQLSDAKGSSGIEQCATQFITVYRDGYYNGNNQDTTTEIAILKNTFGELATLVCEADFDRQVFVSARDTTVINNIQSHLNPTEDVPF